MADGTNNPLTAYFRLMRDLGVRDIVFGQGSEVRKILVGAAAQPAVNAVVSDSRGGVSSSRPAPATQAQAPARQSGGMASSGYAAPPAGGKPGADPLAGLSKLVPVDALGLKKFERTPLSSAPPAAQSSAKREKLAGLYREVVNCGRCEAAHNRAKVVFGAGSADGRLLVAGNAPEVGDDRAGLPFQGEDGELFGKILGKMGLDRKEDVFATYIQKCRGAGFDRGHAGVCRAILDAQIDIINPKALLVFGRPAANFLLENDDDIEQLRGINHTYRGVPAVVTYSLSLMSKETQYRFGAWDDMKRVMNILS